MFAEVDHLIARTEKEGSSDQKVGRGHDRRVPDLVTYLKLRTSKGIIASLFLLSSSTFPSISLLGGEAQCVAFSLRLWRRIRSFVWSDVVSDVGPISCLYVAGMPVG